MSNTAALSLPNSTQELEALQNDHEATLTLIKDFVIEKHFSICFLPLGELSLKLR